VLAVAIIVWPLLYLLLHELMHYFVARVLGFRAYMQMSSDGVFLSPSIYVEGDVDGVYKYAILYSPYIINVLFLFMNNCFVKMMGLLTLPNIVLEEESHRNIRFIFSIILFMFIILVLQKCVSFLCYS